MNANEYQNDAMSTKAGYQNVETLTPQHLRIIVAGLGLAGEAGEFNDHIKKWLAQGHALDYAKLDDEAGDLAWYLAYYADATSTTLDALLRRNLDKLKGRYPDGFAAERSLNREDD